MASRPIRIGFVGCGNVLRHYMVVVEQLRARGLAQAVAACDVREACRAEVRQAHGIETFTTDYRELVASPEVDLVMVHPTDLLHGPVARLALEAGKHVLVEKPMALFLDETGRRIDLERTLQEARALADLALRSPGYLACAPFVVLSPTHQALRGLVRRGELGKVASARARYGSPMPNQPWVYRPGGGPLFNIGTYSLTSLTGLLGPARQVAALTGVAFAERQVNGERVRFEAEEDNAQILLDFGEGVLGVLTTGWTMRRYRSPALELFGDQGTAHMLGEDWAPQGCEVWRSGQEDWQTVPEPQPPWLWTDGLRHFVECIHQGRRPSAMVAHALHVLEVILRAKAAARDGRTRPVESAFDPAALLADCAPAGAPT